MPGENAGTPKIQLIIICTIWSGRGSQAEVHRWLQRRQAVGNCIGSILQEGQILQGVYTPCGQLSENDVKTTGHLIRFCSIDYCNWMTDWFFFLLFNWCWWVSRSGPWFILLGSYPMGNIIYLLSQAELCLPFGCLKHKTRSNRSQMPGNFSISLHFILHCPQRSLKCSLL